MSGAVIQTLLDRLESAAHHALDMGVELIPESLRAKFRFDEREHATAILAKDFPLEFQDILDCLDAFWLKRSAILTPGGARSPIPEAIDGFLQKGRGWN